MYCDGGQRIQFQLPPAIFSENEPHGHKVVDLLPAAGQYDPAAEHGIAADKPAEGQ
jgi:hypothetical protein